VVAAGGLVSAGALATAVVVKLARVLMLAPVLTLLAIRRRRSHGGGRAGAHRPPLVPLFVVAFLACAVLRTTGRVPSWALSGAHVAQTALLTAAMFALGCGVHVASLRRLCGRPLALAFLSPVVVATIALAGALLAG